MGHPINALRKAIACLHQFRGAYLALSLMFYALIAVGAAYAAFNQGSSDLVAKSGRAGVSEVLPFVVSAYKGGHILRAMGWTFVINLLGGSLLYITIPSLIVPFSGLLLAGVRAIVWGMVFSSSILHPIGALSACKILLLL